MCMREWKFFYSSHPPSSTTVHNLSSRSGKLISSSHSSDHHQHRIQQQPVHTKPHTKNEAGKENGWIIRWRMASLAVVQIYQIRWLSPGVVLLLNLFSSLLCSVRLVEVVLAWHIFHACLETYLSSSWFLSFYFLDFCKYQIDLYNGYFKKLE